MSTQQRDWGRAWLDAGSIFTPGSPVNERDLFSGRQEQINTILEAISQRGFHAVLYGDRGVGKTSLSNILSAILNERGVTFLFTRTNCDATDTYDSVWRKVFRDVSLTNLRKIPGFNRDNELVQTSLLENLPPTITPDDVRRVLAHLSQNLLVIVGLDEFDRLENKSVAISMSDTIKALSDSGAAATVLLIGVADSVDELIEGHQSIERCLVQIPMPRMSREETEQIVRVGMQRLELSLGSGSLEEIVSLSQGLPYVTHMLSLHSARATLNETSHIVEDKHVKLGIKKALEQWQQSIVTSYYDATKSHQPDHLFREVLLACALADVDEKSFFTAAAVRTPLRIVARPNLDIPNFSKHLKDFSEARRGEILTREGESRRIRYRFVSPLMRPYIIMRGVADGLLDKHKMSVLGI